MQIKYLLKKIFMENKYKEGESVYAIAIPAQQLIVRRYVDRIYYCGILGNPKHKELVYFERELMQTPQN
jgi:hypothetical protein